MKFSTVMSLYSWYHSLTDGLSSPVPPDQTVDTKGYSKSPDEGISRGPWSELEVFNCCLTHPSPFLNCIRPLEGESLSFKREWLVRIK